MRLVLAGKHPLFRKELGIEERSSRALAIDARNLRFVSPLEICAIVALASRATHDRRSASLLLPEDEDVTSYLQRMDVLRALNGVADVIGSIPREERVNRSDVLLELTRIEHPYQADELAERIVPLARGHSNARVTSAVFIGIGELLDNACSHAGSPIGVYAAAQAYTGRTSKRRGLELAVADAGIGILRHLRGNPKFSRFRSSATAIRYALRPGVSGTRDRRGYGFSDVLDEVGKAGKGRLVIRSGDAIGRVTVQGTHTRSEFVSTHFPYPGTLVWLRIRVP